MKINPIKLQNIHKNTIFNRKTVKNGLNIIENNKKQILLGTSSIFMLFIITKILTLINKRLKNNYSSKKINQCQPIRR